MFSLAAEDETTAVGRRGGSGRGRKQPTSKKDSSSSSANSKKNSDPVKTVYTSDEDSSEVRKYWDFLVFEKRLINCMFSSKEDWSKQKISQAKKRKKTINDSD